MDSEKSKSSLGATQSQIEKVQALRPIDDLCGSVFFQDIGCTQILLRGIMGTPDMKVEKMAVQRDFPNLFGRGGRMDVVAFDSAFGAFDFEFQTEKKGAVLDRAFFNYALLARDFIEKGTKFEDFPFTSIVFVQEKDFFNANQAKAKVKFVLDGNPPVPLESKLNIIYVNTDVKDISTEFGQIVHDLRCSSSEEMIIPAFRVRMDQVKNPKGKEMAFMCEALATEREEGRMEGRIEGRTEGRVEMARETASSMFEMGTPYETVQLLFQDTLSKEDLSQIRQDLMKRIKSDSVVH